MVRVDRILVPPNLPAGMNPLVVMSLVLMYRSTTEHADEPILLKKEGKYYRITDGRHRYIASVIAGRRRVKARVDKQK